MNEGVLKKVIEQYDTPFYVFDIRKVKERIEYLKELLPKNILLCYAIKANTFITKDIEDYIDRFEVCSPGEYEICKATNVNDNKILISGVYKEKEFIEKLLDNYTDIGYYSIESIEQFKIFRKISKSVKVLIRITSGNQFGINENEVEEIIKNRADYDNIDIVGIQYFSGTQKTSIKNLRKEIDYVDNFIQLIYKKYGFKIRELEFGPGFPIYYFQNNEFDEKSFLEEFSEVIENMQFKGNLILELGRSIAASCGNYITKVVDMKTNKNQNYAILDGGIHHLVYYGQSMAMKTPKISTYPTKNNGEGKKWNLCGSLCTINDILVKQLDVKDLNVGDIFIFENTGAYCMTEGISLFLSRNLPKIVKIKDDDTIELIRKNVSTYKFNM